MTSEKFAGGTPEFIHLEPPAGPPGVYLYFPVTGNRPAFVSRYLNAHALLKRSREYVTGKGCAYEYTEM